VTNLTIQQQWTAFKEPDLRDPVQARDMSVLSTMINAGRSGIETRLDVAVQIDSDSRLLAKLGLAVGYKMFGARFLAAEYASTLRAAKPASRPSACHREVVSDTLGAKP
jgi:hypothetical protein